MKIGIIGGEGRMGRWFAAFFREHGHTVLSADRDTELTSEALIHAAEAVIFSLPIAETAAIIDSLLPCTRADQLLIDLTSLKEAPIAAMLRSSCEVLGLHPMFSARVKTLKGQTIVVCRARERERSSQILELFIQAGAQLKETSAMEHDRMMAIVQGLTHFSAIVQAVCLSRLGVPLQETLEYSSPVYRLRSEMIARILGQDPRLYAEIAICNPHVRAVLERLHTASTDLLAAVTRGDSAEFVRQFQNAADFFGDFKSEALAESEQLLEAFSNRSVKR